MSETTTGKDLVWVPVELAKDLKSAIEGETERDIILGYLDRTRMEINNAVEQLGEDVVQYRASMIAAKRDFEKAKNEELDAFNELWEKFEEDMPRIKGKVERAIAMLDPLDRHLKALEERMSRIRTYEIERIADLLGKIENASPAIVKAIGLFVGETEGQGGNG